MEDDGLYRAVIAVNELSASTDHNRIVKITWSPAPYWQKTIVEQGSTLNEALTNAFLQLASFAETYKGPMR